MQEGKNQAMAGGPVTVEQGTCFENIHFRGGSIVLRGIHPVDSTGVMSSGRRG